MTASTLLGTERETGLSLRGVGKRYGPVTVLSDLDLDVRPGEVLGLLGENGAGIANAKPAEEMPLDEGSARRTVRPSPSQGRTNL